MALFNLRPTKGTAPKSDALAALLDGASLEVMPRTAAKIDSFAEILPAGTRVYVAHIEGTPIDEMVATVKRLTDEGFAAMPHVPGRIIDSRATLETWLKRYREEAGAEQALVLAGGVPTVAGEFTSAIDLLKTGLFDQLGFKRLHVAGHPEGNKDIDPAGGTKVVDEALMWKQGFSQQTDAEMAIATQFAFESGPIIAWAERLAAMGITLPIHLGVAGPTKLQTLIKFAIACGVGPSLSVLQKRAMDLTKLLVPFEPTDLLTEIAAYRATNPDSLLQKVHLFPLGGIKTSAEWLGEHK
ncbi:5,10-methylenetetrahydrofolate reductase [Pararhodobacter aggregans]|uniref:5,10-methylenetetrahydrofolate reductase n=1 Tax=Pararhodobacter aggregans TaxID=404875 RepID=A0A2T7UXP8_9RHOB|nr:5,10-methylenetetrahydrofolate reductase [Pararhodobacter aggregans]PTX05000.1 methylenetetrahydrofolate reductase (NADPH) [Pararhodobacter aggregans]PVE49318.1 5,10-methylenetetrahydrofolate reductase [Pararhodobacter aggregans]